MIASARSSRTSPSSPSIPLSDPEFPAAPAAMVRGRGWPRLTESIGSLPRSRNARHNSTVCGVRSSRSHPQRRESRRARPNDALAFLQSEPRRLLLHGENHQFDGGRQIQIAGLGSISSIAARRCGTSAWIRIEAHPLTVGGKTARQIWFSGKHYFTSAAATTCSEPSSRRHRAVSPRTFVAVLVEGDHRDRLTDHKSIDRQGERVFESLAKRPELLVLAVFLHDDFLDQRVHGLTIVGQELRGPSQVSQNGISQSSCGNKSGASQSSGTTTSASSELDWANTSLVSQSQVWAKTNPVSSNLRSSSGCFCARNLSLLVL